jgi:hypothetical protein
MAAKEPQLLSPGSPICLAFTAIANHPRWKKQAMYALLVQHLSFLPSHFSLCLYVSSSIQLKLSHLN